MVVPGLGNQLHRRVKHQEREIRDFNEVEDCTEWEQMAEEQDLVNLAIQYVETADLFSGGGGVHD